MITTVSPNARLVDPTPATAPRATTLGKNEFLRLLVTQLRHQDPLSPLQPHEFAAQLAQFASVEQLTQLNEGLASQLEAARLDALIGKTALGAALLGRAVIASDNQVEIPTTGSAQIHVESAGAGRASLRLLDASGTVVATRDLGTVAAGRQTLTLPADLPPGTYRYELAVTAADGSDVPTTPYTTGIVSGVFFRDGQILLRLGGLEVPLDTLAEIEPAPPSTITP